MIVLGVKHPHRLIENGAKKKTTVLNLSLFAIELLN